MHEISFYLCTILSSRKISIHNIHMIIINKENNVWSQHKIYEKGTLYHCMFILGRKINLQVIYLEIWE